MAVPNSVMFPQLPSGLFLPDPATANRGSLSRSAWELDVRNIIFDQTVSIFIGLGFSHEVSDVLEAYKLLNEWPESGRGRLHLMALHTCAAVLGGHGTGLDARTAFKAFAADRGI